MGGLGELLEDRLELDELDEYGRELGELVADSLGLGESGRKALTFLLFEQ